jgi:hypothetical protein
MANKSWSPFSRRDFKRLNRVVKRLLRNSTIVTHIQGCQIIYFQTKSPKLGNFLKALIWKKSLYILWPFGIFYGHWGYFMTI